MAEEFTAESGAADSPGPDEGTVLGWSVVANTLDTARAEKHFVPGTKAWVLPSPWSFDTGNVLIVARRRGRGARLIRLVFEPWLLTNFRAEGVYSPTVYRLLTDPWPGLGYSGFSLYPSREDAEDKARIWREVYRDGRRRDR